MPDPAIELSWRRSEPELGPEGYANRHLLRFTDAHALPADAAPGWGGDPASINPEQSLAASPASCHMMTFLALSAKAGWPVASYSDRAVAHLGKTSRGCMAVTRIGLRPVVRFDTGFGVDVREMAKMQDRAHRHCFIANTLSDDVEIDVLATNGDDADVRHPEA